MLQSTLQLYRDAYSGLSREVWLLSLISLVNRAGTMVFPFLTIYLTQSLHYSLKEAGIIMSFFGLGSILGSYCGGWLTDRIGPFKVQFWSLFLTSLLIFIGAYFLFILEQQTFWGVAGMAFLLSTISDAFRPANKVAVANYSQPENLTRSFALLRLAVNLGFAIGPAMGGILAAWKGYDWLFYADGFTCLLAALIFKFTLKDDFKERSQLQKAALKEQKEKVVAKSPYQDQIYLFFLVIVSILAFAFLQLFYTIPVYFKQDLGMEEGQIGLLMGLNGLIIVLIEMPLVYLAEQRYSKFLSMAMGAFFIGCGYLCFLLPSFWIGIAIISMTILTIGEIYYMPFASAFAAARATDANRGEYMALYTIAWAIASVVAPATGFQLVESFGFEVLWITLFLLCTLGSIGFWFLGKAVNQESISSKKN